jgi:predicted Zn-dependent protease
MILHATPSSDALHRLSQLLAAKGDFAAAKRLFRILTTVRPDAAKAWQCLGQVCESLGQHEEALRQHLEFMRLQPAAIEPASARSVRKWREWRPTPDRQTASEHLVSVKSRICRNCPVGRHEAGKEDACSR